MAKAKDHERGGFEVGNKDRMKRQKPPIQQPIPEKVIEKLPKKNG